MTTGSEAMPTPEDSTPQLEDLVDDLTKVAGAVLESQVASHQGEGVPGWAGTSADQYLSSILGVGELAREAGQTVLEAVKALEGYREVLSRAVKRTVPDLQDAYDEANRVYEAGLTELNDDIEDADNRGVPMSSYESQQRHRGLVAARDQAQEELLRSYKAVINKLAEQAQDSADKVLAVQKNLLGDLPVDASREQIRDHVSTTLFNDIPVVDGQAEWERAQKSAPEIAGMIKDGDLTAEEIERFRKQYGPKLSNPFVAAAVAELVSPEEMMDFSMRVAYAPIEDRAAAEDVLRQMGSAVVLATGGTNADDANVAHLTSFEAAQKGLLLEDGDALTAHRSEYIEGLKEAGNAVYYPWDYSDDPYTPGGAVEYAPSGYDLLTQMIGSAGQANPDLALGEEFFTGREGSDSLAHDIVAWDAKRSNLHNKYVGNPSFFSDDPKMSDPMHALYTVMDPADNYDPDSATAERVEAHERRARGIRAFLDSPVPDSVLDEPHAYARGWPTKEGHELPELTMTRYLTGGRTTTDGQGYMGFQDGGEIFGEIIHEASKPDPDFVPSHPDPKDFPLGENDPAYKRVKGDYEAALSDDTRRAEIAADFIAGYQDGLSIERIGDKSGGEDIFGKSNPRLRSWVGSVMSHHIEGTANSLQGETTDPETGAVNIPRHGALISFSEMDAARFMARGGLFEDLAFDNPAVIAENDPDNPLDDEYEGGRRPALHTLRLTAHQEYMKDLHYANQTIPGETAEQYQARQREIISIVDNWAPLTNSLYVASADADVAVQQALDERNAAWQKGLGLVVDAIPFADLASSDFSKYAVNGLAGEGLPRFMEEAWSTSNALGHTGEAEQHSAARKALLDGVYEALSENPNWRESFSPADDPGNQQPGSPVDFSHPDFKGSGFVQDGKMLHYSEMSADARQDFENWVSNKTSHKDVIDAVGLAIDKSESIRNRANDLIHGQEG